MARKEKSAKASGKQEKAKQKIREQEFKGKLLNEKIPKNARNKSGLPGPKKGTSASGGKERMGRK